MPPVATTLVWVALTLPALLLVQRWIHRHLRGVTLLLAGNEQAAVTIYALILFPGVLLHELSHWLCAKLLGVRTAGLSLRPTVHENGSLQLGYVEYFRDRRLDPVRESLIGAAPLIAGVALITLIGYQIFDLNQLATTLGNSAEGRLTLVWRHILQTQDVFLWLYVLFAVSNAMLPSPSDRRAWPGFLLVAGGVTAVLYLFGWQDWLALRMAGPLTTLLGYVGFAFSLTIGLDILFALLISLIEWGLGRLKGVRVMYDR